uniref:FAF domain-containing protein n=1 Tax=Leersia perrieri TaxID=77586 RepID=A0A0D9WG43_9ORYZ
MPSLIDSTPQPAAASGDWSSLYAAAPAEPMVKASPRHVLVAPAKKPAAYGTGAGRKVIIKNLEMCTEALGCETGGVDVIAAGEDVVVVEAAEGAAERKRREREEAAESEASRVRRALPPPLTTLTAARGRRVRMVQERRDGRLAVYAVRTGGVQAERCGGRLRLRLVPCAGCTNAAECHQKEKQLIRQEAEEVEEAMEHKHEAEEEEEEYGGFAKYVRGGRCVEAEVAAGEKWEPEQAARIWVVT